MAIDVICLIVLAYGFWQGYSKGIISTIFNTLAYLFGITLAFKMTPTTTNILEALFHSTNPLMFLAGFLANLFFIMFLLRQAARGMEGLFQAAYLGTINQLFGGAFLGGVYVLIFSVLVWFASEANLLDDLTISQSRTYPVLKELPGQAKSVAIRFKPLASDLWDTSINWMDRMKSYGIQKTETKPKIYELPDEEAPDPKDKKSAGGIEKDPDL